MLTTNKYHLKKPEGTDQVDIQDFNDNADIIDEELGKRPEKTGDASNMTNTFTQASSRTQLVSGESLKTSLGKIMKWFADLKTVAFTGKYTDLSEKPVIPSGTAAACGVVNNLTTTVAGYVLDARQGKALKDEINTLNGSLQNQIKIISGKVSSVSINPGEAPNVTIPITVPAGYHATQIKSVAMEHGRLIVSSSWATDNQVTCAVHNRYSSIQTDSITISVLCIKN